jgi:TolB protein
LLLALAALAPRAWAINPEAVPIPGYNLHVRIVDGVTGALLPVRVSIVDAEGRSVYPLPRRSHLYHDTYFGLKYFYAEDEFTVIVPSGTTTVRAMHGFEYRTIEQTVEVEDDTDLTLELLPFLDMPSLGWRSGDTHVHMNHTGIDTYELTTPDVFLMQRAEDVHMVHVLENGVNFIGAPDPASTPDHLIYFAVEYRSAFWGHMDILGTSGLTSYGCCSRGGYAFPMNLDLTAQARSLGGTVIFAHPITVDRSEMGVIDQGWPSVGHGRELPIDVALGAIDAIDVYSYSNKNRLEFSTWYDFLNHGFRIPASAGTDTGVNGVNAPALGGYRVYAQVGNGPWTVESWLEAIRRGNSFVTNGPLIQSFKVAGAGMGSVVPLSTEQARHVRCTFDVSSQWSIDVATILVNGSPKAYIYAGSQDKSRIQGDVTVDTGGGSAWIALKVMGYKPNPFTIGQDMVAHSNPVYITVSGKPILFGGPDPLYYVDWINDVWNIALGKGFATTSDRDLTEARLTQARNIILNRTIVGPDRDPTVLPPPPEDGSQVDLLPEGSASAVTRLSARVLPGGRGITFGFGDGAPAPESFELYDVVGRRVASRRIDQGEASSGSWSWTPSEGPLRAGVYFAVFRRQEWSGSLRVVVVT